MIVFFDKIVHNTGQVSLWVSTNSNFRGEK